MLCRVVSVFWFLQQPKQLTAFSVFVWLLSAAGYLSAIHILPSVQHTPIRRGGGGELEGPF